MAQRKQTATVDVKVRMKEPLRAHLEKAAKSRGISMNAEIVDRLERSMDRVGLLEDALALAFGDQITGLLRDTLEGIRKMMPVIEATGPIRELILSRDAQGKTNVEFKVFHDGALKLIDQRGLEKAYEEFDEMLRRHGLSQPEGPKT